MGKFYGSVGFVITEEKEPNSGVFVENKIERKYYGEVIKNTRRYQASETVNDNISLGNEISILADPYAFENLCFIRYVEFLGHLWNVSSVEIQYPRLILSLGDIYTRTEA